MIGAARFAQTSLINLPRSRFFFGLFLLATLNGLAGLALPAITQNGWLPTAANLFNISAIIWAALFAGLKVLSDDPEPAPIRQGDFMVGIAITAVSLVPIAAASMVALTALALYTIVTSAPRSALRRSAIIFAAMTGPLIWGRIFLAVFSGPVLGADALLVASLLGAEHQGNMLWLAGEPARLIVAPGCSSLQGISIALLLWITINQLFEVRFGLAALLSCLAALGATVAINIVRIAGMLVWPEWFDVIHTGWGYHLLMWTTFGAVAAITIFGARREILGAR